jgi:hypothetical protein
VSVQVGGIEQPRVIMVMAMIQAGVGWHSHECAVIV